ncbi:ArsR/SmtB family transcription factor [Kutzneria kofuensis]|uniref:DNA-binding transcriptional ArsR family regulator n=1 Tax=Kutzneria kofuensis TaxID=103725 RepID=A0A7W9NMP6_9PSEU|nr:helix-turn-helix domain-containing protein [Kutzneria kofuensis]MBB5897578.1 DNA-binding transcriptional ArsR family regulator [Kutzneria kofuensis]
MRTSFHPAAADISLAAVMHALSDPARLAIVAMLASTDGEICNHAGTDLDLHKSTISHHYRVLREAGVTLTTMEGRNRVVRLRTEDLNARFPGLLDAVLAALAR